MMRTLNQTISDRELSDYKTRYRDNPDVLRLVECMELDREEIKTVDQLRQEEKDARADADESDELLNDVEHELRKCRKSIRAAMELLSEGHTAKASELLGELL